MDRITIGANKNKEQSSLLLKMANRHGLIAGATGTGKTVTLKVMAEQFAKAGTPVFLTDVKGDLSGFISKGSEHAEVTKRVDYIGLKDFKFEKLATVFWDLYGEHGHPVRTTISEMGPVLISKLLDLNANQEDLISLAFKYADEEGLLLLDIKDLKSILIYMEDSDDEDLEEYGNIAKSSVGAIVRRLTALEESGGEEFFTEPALEIKDLLKKDFSGNGIINILDARKLMLDQRLYGTFLLWFLSELFEELPESGDLDKPKMVLFFDEAHLLFKDISKSLLEKIEMVVKLIRSKGVGVYFVTQNPVDIPSSVLSQLGNKIIHGLRSFTEKDRKAIRALSSGFRVNPDFEFKDVVGELKVGESLVSFLDADGAPTVLERVLNCPPISKFGPADENLVKDAINNSPFLDKYKEPVDRESAFEILKVRKKKELEETESEEAQKLEEKAKKKKSSRQGPVEAFFKSMLRAIGSQLGRQIIRGVMGSIKRR